MEAAFRRYEVDSCLVDEGDQVPEDIARGSKEKDAAFTYAELFEKNDQSYKLSM
jgi:hypothetical protein